MYRHSYFELFGGLIAVIMAVVWTIRKRNLLFEDIKTSRKFGVFIIVFGILSVSLGCFFNSWATHRWDSDYMIAFLELKRLNGYGWLFRGPAYIGYTLIIWGITILLILNKAEKKANV